MSKKNAPAGTSPFAHLMAGFRGKRAEEPQEDEAARAARRAEEDEKREEEDARRAEEDQRRTDEDARHAEEDGDEPGDDKPEKGKKADGDPDQDPEADADDDDAEEGTDEKEAKAFRRGLVLGRTRENARAARIFGAAAAAGRPDLAATLAFTTRNTSAEAERLMGAATAGTPKARGRLDDRMGARSDARPGTGSGSLGGKLSFAERAAAASKKAGIR